MLDRRLKIATSFSEWPENRLREIRSAHLLKEPFFCNNCVSRVGETPTLGFILALDKTTKAIDLLVEQEDGLLLTDREVETLRWASEGKSSWEIGEILNISERTVVNHLKNAQTKLNAVNRTHAVVVALRGGMLR